jgi:hypothetical protein
MEQMSLDFVLQMLFVTDRLLRVLQPRECGLLSISVHLRPIVADFLQEGHQASLGLRNLRVVMCNLLGCSPAYGV